MAIAVTGCGTPTATSIVDELGDAALCRLVQDFDSDCDGVNNEVDRAPNRHDYGDDDGDFIFNALDLYDGVDDTTVDSDGDLVPDYIDGYPGVDYHDDDGDGIANAVDVQPTVPLAAGQLPSEQDNRSLAERVVLNGFLSDQMEDLIDRGPDEDGDGSPDHYDPDPDNGWITETYDPWDPGSDANRYDPYDPGSDAWYDDDSNGWGD